MKRYAQKTQNQEKGYFTTPKPSKKNPNLPNFDNFVLNAPEPT